MTSPTNSAANIALGVGTESALEAVTRMREGIAALTGDLAKLAAVAKATDISASLKAGLSGASSDMRAEADKAAKGVASSFSAAAGEKTAAEFGVGMKKGVKSALADLEDDATKAAARIKYSVSQTLNGVRITQTGTLPADSAFASNLAAKAAPVVDNPDLAAAAAKQQEEQAKIQALGRLQAQAQQADIARDYAAEVQARRAGLAQVAAEMENERRARTADVADRRAGLTQVAAEAEDQARRLAAETQARRAGLTQVAAVMEDERRTRAAETAERKAGLTQVAAEAEDQARRFAAEKQARQAGLTVIAAEMENERRTRAGEIADRKLGLAQAAAGAEDEARRLAAEAQARRAGLTQVAAEAENEKRMRAAETAERRAGLTQIEAQAEDEKRRLAAETQARRAGLTQVAAAMEDERRTRQKDLEAQRAQNAEKKAADADALQNARFSASNLASQVKQLQVVAALQAQGPKGQAAAESAFTPEILAQVAALPQLEAELKNVAEAHGRSAEKANLHTVSMRAANEAGKDLHSTARGLAQSFDAMWASWGSMVPLVAAAALGGAIAAVIKQGKDAEYQLAFVKGMTEEVVTLNQVLAVTAGSQFTPKEGIEGLRALTQAGLSVKESLSILPEVMNLAQLGEMNMGQAALTVTGAIHAFNLEVSDAGRVGDVFAKAAAVSNTSVSGIAESMKQASTVADFYHVSVEQTAASLAVLAKRNIEGTQAGTAFRNALQELVTPSKKASEAMKALNVEAFDGTKLKEYDSLLDEFQAKTAGLNEKSRLLFLKDVFGERGSKAINAILSDYDLYKKTLDDVKNSTDFLTKAQAELADTVEGAYKRAASALQGSFINAFQAASPALKQFFDQLAQTFSSDGFQSSLKTLITGVIEITKAVTDHIGTIALLVGGYAAARLALSVTTGLTAALTGILNAHIVAKREDVAVTTLSTEATLRAAAAKELDAAAGVSGAVAATKYASAVGTFAGALTSALGVIGLIITAGTALYAVYEMLASRSHDAAGAIDTSTNSMAKAIKVIDDETDALNRQIASLREQQGLKQQDQKDSISRDRGTTNTKIAAEQKRLAEINAEIKQNEDDAKVAQRTAGADGGIDMSAILGPNNKLLAEKAALQADIQRNTDNLTKSELGLYNVEKLRGERDIEAAKVKIASQAKEILGDPTEGTKGAIANKKIDPSIIAQVKQIAEDAKNDKGNILDEAAAMQKLVVQVRELGTSYNGVTKPGPANRAYEDKIKELREVYEEEKRLADIERQGSVTIAKDNRRAGVFNVQQETSAIDEAYKHYEDRVTVAGAYLLEQEKKYHRASDQDREVYDQRRFLAETERDRLTAAARMEQDRLVAENQAKLEVAKETASIRGKLNTAAADEGRRRTNNAAKISEEFMSADQKAQLAAAVQVTGVYGKILDGVNAAKVKLISTMGEEAAARSTEMQGLNASTDLIKKEEQAQISLAKAEAHRIDAYRHSYEFGMSTAVAKFSDNARDNAKRAEDSMTSAFNNMGTALDKFVTTGKLSFKSLALSIVQDLIKIQTRAQLSGIFSMLGKALGGYSGGGSPGGSPGDAYQSSAMADAQTYGNTGGLHEGGIVGGTPTFTRTIDMAHFSGAPRFHTGGIVGGEVPIIAKKGEGVFTPEQMAALAPARSSSDAGSSNQINVVVNIDQAGNAKTDTKASGDQTGRELGQIMETAIQAWVTKNKRPGGQLAG